MTNDTIIKSFRATGSNGAYSYGDNPRQAAERFFERFDTRRKCNIIEGRINDGFFTVQFGKGAGLYLKNVTKAAVRTLPDTADGAPAVPAVPMVDVCREGGEVVSVPSFGTFCRDVDGKRYTFHVTDALECIGKVVTEARTGLKACDVAVTHADIVSFSKARTDVDRARVALDAVVARFGEARVARVIDDAPTMGAKNLADITSPAGAAASI